jgi:hypothetical protein
MDEIKVQKDSKHQCTRPKENRQQQSYFVYSVLTPNIYECRRTLLREKLHKECKKKNEGYLAWMITKEY